MPDPASGRRIAPRAACARAALFASASLVAFLSLGVGCAKIVDETPTNPCGPEDRPPGGVRISIGSSSASYIVPAGTEDQWTVTTKFPTHVGMDVHRLRLAACPGAMSVRLLDSDTDLGTDSLAVGFDEPDWSMWHAAVVGGSDGIDWTLPDSVALRLRHHAQLEVAAHYLNLPGAPVTGSSVGMVATFEPAPVDPTYLLSSMLIEETGFSLGPHATQEVTKTVTLPHAVTLLALAGEYHEYGTRLTVEAADAPDAAWQTIYDTTARVPQFSALASPVRIPAGGLLRVTATYDNTSDATVTAGPRWDGDEACRVFAFHTAAPLPALAEMLLFQ